MAAAQHLGCGLPVRACREYKRADVAAIRGGKKQAKADDGDEMLVPRKEDKDWVASQGGIPSG